MPISDLEYQDFVQATENLRALAHPIRMQIIRLLADDNGRSVKDIHEELGIQQPVASHHLRILKDKHIVLGTRSGQSTIYQLTNTDFAQLTELALGSISK